MNVLNSKPLQQSLPPALMQGIQQAKQMQSMCGGNIGTMFQQLAQANPQFAQVLQMAQNGNPEQIVRQMCQQRGVDFNAFMNALK